MKLEETGKEALLITKLAHQMLGLVIHHFTIPQMGATVSVEPGILIVTMALIPIVTIMVSIVLPLVVLVSLCFLFSFTGDAEEICVLDLCQCQMIV